MMNKILFLSIPIGAGILLLIFFLAGRNMPGLSPAPAPNGSSSIPISDGSSRIPTSDKLSNQELASPIGEFKQRITKKPFGLYVTPQNSPVKPERFSGYHTGDDVEYQDITTDVPVYAVNDGIVTLSRTASGYGGVFILKTSINGKSHSIVYGHIRPSTLPVIGKNLKKGEKIAVLGTGYSKETDGERRHLHFGVLSDDRLDIRGYVGNRDQLSGWVNPLSLYP